MGILGLSLFDVGSNNYINTTTFLLANFDPYGETFFKHPNGIFSDAWLNMPCYRYYYHPASYPDDYIFGANFASAGSGALVETRQGTVIGLQTQASYFKQVSKLLKKKLGDREAKAFLGRAV
ncbi:GDSL esterase/lipase 5-like [Neltuma alba]|uniref:GDSL esterase/lipase 5-like n=1 Tax=Neltuma alba TaxID=207710 RepID=UPI0010A4891A|nr:GDSL esterase/lipase 5-like [Prosopis alba]